MYKNMKNIKGFCQKWLFKSFFPDLYSGMEEGWRFFLNSSWICGTTKDCESIRDFLAYGWWTKGGYQITMKKGIHQYSRGENWNADKSKMWLPGDNIDIYKTRKKWINLVFRQTPRFCICMVLLCFFFLPQKTTTGNADYKMDLLLLKSHQEQKLWSNPCVWELLTSLSHLFYYTSMGKSTSLSYFLIRIFQYFELITIY